MKIYKITIKHANESKSFNLIFMPPKLIGGFEEIEDCKQIATLIYRVL